MIKYYKIQYQYIKVGCPRQSLTVVCCLDSELEAKLDEFKNCTIIDVTEIESGLYYSLLAYLSKQRRLGAL